MAAYVIEHEAHVSPTLAVLTTAVPVLRFTAGLFGVYSLLMARFDPFHTLLFAGSIAVLVIAVPAVGAGASLGIAPLVVAAAPLVVIIGYETVGYRHQAAALAEDQAGRSGVTPAGRRRRAGRWTGSSMSPPGMFHMSSRGLRRLD